MNFKLQTALPWPWLFIKSDMSVMTSSQTEKLCFLVLFSLAACIALQICLEVCSQLASFGYGDV